MKAAGYQVPLTPLVGTDANIFVRSPGQEGVGASFWVKLRNSSATMST